MENRGLDHRLRLMQHADMKGKVVLVRVDHNVVKNGRIKDPYRIDATIGTLYAIAEGGGRPVLITHVGRPKDKKTGRINCSEGESVVTIAKYIEQKLPVKIHVQRFSVHPEKGIEHLDGSIMPAIENLKAGKIGMIYLPNSRWFQGEQSDGPERDSFADELAGIADMFVNDAFGSWQAHVSTYDIAERLPSFAGILLQKELGNLGRVLNPDRPFVAVIAGAKYDTKIGPLRALYDKVDYLILGGLIYNTYLSAKYGVQIASVSEEDKTLAAQLVGLDRKENKILEMPYLVESDIMEERIKGRFRTVSIEEMRRKKEINYVLDIDPRSNEEKGVKDVIGSARTIIVNAVLGFKRDIFL